MKSNKKYWKGIGQLKNDPNIEKLAHNEFSEKLPLDTFLSEDLSHTSTSRMRQLSNLTALESVVV